MDDEDTPIITEQIQIQQQQLLLARAVLIDIDGTFVDSNPSHAMAWRDACQDFGFIQVTYEKAKPLIGMGSDKIIKELTGLEKDSTLAKELISHRMEIFKTKYLPNLQPFPKARELLMKMSEGGLRMIVATSAKDDEMEAILKQADLNDLCDTRTSGSEARHSKPDPDIISAAIDKCDDIPKEQILMLGDTPYDIESAKRAGIRIVAVTCGGWSRESLQGAEEIYEGPADILEHYDQTAFARLYRQNEQTTA